VGAAHRRLTGTPPGARVANVMTSVLSFGDTTRLAGRKLQRHFDDFRGRFDYVERRSGVLDVTAGVLRGGGR
jgi:hypothetical protein